MRLKQLDIYGFKSFADRTHMEFGSGITGVVGPNGSGKSNISDAVRWVLGEQSARTLRGAKMEDVIFSGTEKRKPMAYCEVSLTLDNSDGALPVGYTEVLITRRVYRSGESEYFLNKTACRLKDIVDMFRDTGIGKEGYSLIGQGRIDEILSARGEDRRAVFEEAAGIAKYKARKAEAERRIDNTNQNLVRVEDIISEAERQIGPLEKQAEKARRYIQMYDELRLLDVSQFVMRYDSARQRIDQREIEAEGRRAAIAQAQTRCDGVKTARDELDAQQARADAMTQELRDAVVELTRGVEERQGELRLLDERIQAQQREDRRLTGELDGMRAEHDRLTVSRDGLVAAQQDQSGESRRLQSELTARDLELTRQAQEADEESERIEDRKERLMETLNRLSDVKSARARLTAMRQAITERIEACERDCDSLSGQRMALAQLEQEGEGSMADALKRQDEVRALRRAVDGELTRNREERARTQDASQKLILNRQQTETRLKVLREMVRDYEGYQFAVKQVMMRADKAQDKGIIGVVASILRVPRELERATDMVLGAALQNVIVETEQDAKRMIEYLRTNRYGRATFLPVTSVKGRTLTPFERQALETEGCLGVLSELVEFDKRYQGIVDNLLGRTVVARDLDAGIEIMRKGRHAFRLVTLEGDVMHSGGSMTGGSVQSRVTNLLSRDREIGEHQTALRTLDERLLRAHEHMTKLEGERSALHARIDEHEAQLRACEDDVLRLNQQLEQTRKERAALDERVRRTETERDNLRVNLDDVLHELGGLTGEQGAAESDHEQMQREIADQQRELTQRRQELEDAREELTRRRIELAERMRDENAREGEIRRIEEEIQAQSAAIARAEQLLAGGAQACAQLERQQAQTRAGLDGAVRELEQAKARLDAADADHEARSRKRRELEAELEERQADLSAFGEQLHALELQLDRARTELDALQQRIWKDYELTYEACAEQADRGIALNEADRRIGELRGGIRELGSVNVNAAAEYEEAGARLADLTAQRDDLLRAREDLERIIEDLTGRMKEQFTRQFRLLDERFRVSFRALFGGGTARLILQDESDVLGCGIDIAAQPPGKKLQMLSLLSGGERALTAIAILFAMLDIRPTPFCILDEIEAALDDANIDNFAQYLSRYSEKTQFIVVTHRKGTMECCDALYGVSAEEKGVSSMVSVALTEVN